MITRVSHRSAAHLRQPFRSHCVARPLPGHQRAVSNAGVPTSPANPFAELKQWVLQHDPQPPVLLTPKELDGRGGGGYGMVAEQPVEQGQILVRVPCNLIMTVETAEASPLCADVVSLEGITSWQALCLHLLCERAAGPESFWHVYIKTLPTQDQHPLLWTEAQQAWLEGSPMLTTLTQRRQQVQEDTETLVLAGANELPVAVQYRQQHQADMVTEASMQWAAATLLSRSFNLDLDNLDGSWAEGADDDDEGAALQDGEGEPSVCLVPWADLLNHSSEAGDESVLRYDPEAGSAVLRAHRSYAPGEEVFDSYGTMLSPTNMLMDYGYVDPTNSNDRVEVPTRLVVSPRSPRNAALLEAIEKLEGELAISLSPTGPDEGCMSWLRAALASDAELIKSGWRIRSTSADIDAACGAMGRLSEPSSVATEEAALNALSSFVARQLEAYPSSLQQDLEALQKQELPWLQRQVLAALASEKRALLGTEMAVTALQARLKEGWALDQLYVDLPTPWAILRGEGSPVTAADGEQGEEEEEGPEDDPESWR